MVFTCDVCPHYCELKHNEIGKCLVRSGDEVCGSKLLQYGRISTLAIEPVEKRPFFHFHPGCKFLSVGFQGCSMTCSFCVPGETLIRTLNGLVRIDQIRVGDEIIAVDNSNETPQPVLARVYDVFDREAEEVIELEVDGQTIQLTPEHPVLTKQRGWVEARYLTVDDEVLCDKIDLK